MPGDVGMGLEVTWESGPTSCWPEGITRSTGCFFDPRDVVDDVGCARASRILCDFF